ncbi:hypothetical protein J6590_099826 [Homalodisca vitripennis]|nr:hypothetical protein J6590_099826 [Homalodisca vitripennis]
MRFKRSIFSSGDRLNFDTLSLKASNFSFLRLGLKELETPTELGDAGRGFTSTYSHRRGSFYQVAKFNTECTNDQDVKTRLKRFLVHRKCYSAEKLIAYDCMTAQTVD